MHKIKKPNLKIYVITTSALTVDTKKINVGPALKEAATLVAVFMLRISTTLNS